MKNIKTFENFKTNLKLIVKFKSEDDYERAVEYFENESQFFPESTNDEFRSIYFDCIDQYDADATEVEISNELIRNDFSNYYFETEQ